MPPWCRHGSLAQSRGGEVRPQKNRAPVPGIPGLQQSQFTTLGDTETANHCHAKGGPSGSNGAKWGSSEATRAPEAKIGKWELPHNVASWKSALSLPAFRSIRWCDRRRLLTKLQARTDTTLAPAGLARTGSGFGLLPPTCPHRDNRVRRRPARHGQAASPSHRRRAGGR